MQDIIDIISFVWFDDVLKGWGIVSFEGRHLFIPVLFLSDPIHDLDTVCDFEELVNVLLDLV